MREVGWIGRCRCSWKFAVVLDDAVSRVNSCGRRVAVAPASRSTAKPCNRISSRGAASAQPTNREAGFLLHHERPRFGRTFANQHHFVASGFEDTGGYGDAE